MSGLRPGEEDAPLRALATLQEHVFRSQVPLLGPLIAWFRHFWNSISTRWYVRPVIQQQSEFNKLILDRLAAQAVILDRCELRLQEMADRLNADEARWSDHASLLASIVARLNAQAAHLGVQDAQLMAQAGSLDAHEACLTSATSKIEEQGVVLGDHDAWLLAQDHAQVDLVRDLAEASMHLIRMRQAVEDLAARLDHLAQ